MRRSSKIAGSPPIRLRVRVKPGARRNAFERAGDGRYRVSIKAPPVDGQANAALIEFLARAFGTSKSNVFIISGATSREKLVEVREPRRSPVINASSADF